MLGLTQHMNILVTGAAGFIGFNLCQRLLAQGETVIGIDNFCTGQPNHIKTLSKQNRFSFIKQDISKPYSISRMSISRIYHLACPTGVDNLLTLAEEMLLACSSGTRNTLELARLHHADFFLASSSEIYGDPEKSPQSEEYSGNVDPIGERSAYEEGKRFAESLTHMYFRKYRLNTKIVRIFNTYGPGMSLKDTRVIPAFFRQLLSGQPLTVMGRGDQKRTFCYIDDIINGFFTVMEKGKAGDVYNVGSETEIRVFDLADQMIHMFGTNGKITFTDRPPHDHQTRHPSLKKIKQLGWIAKTPLSVGLQMTAHYYQLNRFVSFS